MTDRPRRALSNPAFSGSGDREKTGKNAGPTLLIWLRRPAGRQTAMIINIGAVGPPLLLPRWPRVLSSL